MVFKKVGTSILFDTKCLSVENMKKSYYHQTRTPSINISIEQTINATSSDTHTTKPGKFLRTWLENWWPRQHFSELHDSSTSPRFVHCKCSRGCLNNSCSCVKATLNCSDPCKCVNCKNAREGDSSYDDDTYDYLESSSDGSDCGLMKRTFLLSSFTWITKNWKSIRYNKYYLL